MLSDVATAEPTASGRASVARAGGGSASPDPLPRNGFWAPGRVQVWHEGDPPGFRQFRELGSFTTERGAVLDGVRVAFQSWGTLNAARDNAVLVLHALTGDSHVIGEAGPNQPTPGWWDGLIGSGATLDTDELYVVAPNVLGGCQGTTGPSSVAPDGRPYGSRFPSITIRDQVAVEAMLADALGIDRFLAVIGGSMGGMRVVEWAVSHPDRVRAAVAIATCGYASGDQIGWTTPQLAAIRNDPDFAGGDYYGGPWPLAGMAVARQIAHLTYRSELELNTRFGREGQAGEDLWSGGRFAVQSYLEYHGGKLGRRFDPNSYLVLTEAMNSHDIGRGRGGLQAALERITAELTVAVVNTDRLFPPHLGRELATAPTARPLITMRSDYGHDGFLIEAEQVAAAVFSAVASIREHELHSG
jgi:homoserine O-acetyltransferase/O-succinyltransferase